MLKKIRTYFFCFFYVFCLVCFFCFGCNSNSKNESNKKQSAIKSSNKPTNIESIIKLPNKFKKNYFIREVKIYRGLVNKNNVFASVKIAFTKIKNKKDIIDNMKQAIIDTYKERKAPYAIEVLAYNLNDDIEKDYTLGKATFEAKDERQILSEYKLNIEMRK